MIRDGEVTPSLMSAGFDGYIKRAEYAGVKSDGMALAGARFMPHVAAEQRLHIDAAAPPLPLSLMPQIRRYGYHTHYDVTPGLILATIVDAC